MLFLGEGHVLYLTSMETNLQSCALVVMDYINTTGKCLQLHYEWLRVGYLDVYLIGEDRQLELVTAVSYEQTRESFTWKTLVAKLPSSENLKQIIIKGIRTTNGTSGIALDDISIRSCSDYGDSLKFMCPLS